MINHDLCEYIQGSEPRPDGFKWTYRDDNDHHYHRPVDIKKSPFYIINLSWRETKKHDIKWIGVFRLNLPALLDAGYIRWDPKDSSGPYVRVQIVRDIDGIFYIQTKPEAPKLQLF